MAPEIIDFITSNSCFSSGGLGVGFVTGTGVGLGAGIGALGRGIQTSIAGGSPEMLAYIAQGPVRAAEAYQRGITSMPRQDVPVFAARPTPDRRYFS